MIRLYEEEHGQDETTLELRALYDVTIHYEQVPPNTNVLQSLEAIASKHGETPDFFVLRFTHALETGQIDTWAENYGYSLTPLSIDKASLLGNDPQVDITVRQLMQQVHQRLRPYPPAQWDRLFDVCTKLVQCVQAIRDGLPLYTLSDLDYKKGKQGLGQQATEDDLQEDLFERLRLMYGRTAEFELTFIGGGRSDNGLKFPEAQFPIEVKAEYTTVERDHIRQNYLGQPDIYASVRDRVAFLLILDARKNHSYLPAGKRKQVSQQPNDAQVKLYSLDESFWVDGLDHDPQIEGAKRNAVIVGLVPGNRRKPSAGTVYSRRPKQSSS